uniref:Uncharacterized protein n=1 Tax=Lophocladia kuetzingii TaxID=675577 RepID=A0A1Z1MND5_9FLOR|nr:hypothetical protein [Lophocladia kuetzingii]ARW67617.1 hypothetical protein [Lophocladia kuetzingii]
MMSNINGFDDNSNHEYNILNNSHMDDIDMPGWSFICLDEAISYYTYCNNKMNINNEIVDQTNL